MALEKEFATYTAKLPELAGSEGKFALVRGDQLLDIFSTCEDAIKAGYKQCGLQPFLVKQIQTVERSHFISRCIEPIGKAS